MNEHPIDPFLAAWSAASGVDGFASRLRAYQALRLPGPWTRARLRAALSGVLVLTPEQHGRFCEIFDLWFGSDGRDAAIEVESLDAWLAELRALTGKPGRVPAPRGEQVPPVPMPQPTPAVPRRRTGWLLLGGLLALLLVLLPWWLGRSSSPAAITHDAGADTMATLEADPVAVTEQPSTEEEWARHQLAFEFTPAPKPAWSQRLVWIAVGLVMLCLLIELLLLWRRRQFRSVKAKPIRFSDDWTELDLYTGTAPKPLSAASLDRIAFRTGLVPDFELPKLNPDKTVRRTARNAGCFSPVHDPRAQTRGLSIVRPRCMDPVSEAVLACFAEGLRARAVPVCVLTGPPRWDTDDLVLLLVDGRFPEDPPLERWQTIPHLALVEVRDPDTWGSEMGKLPHGVSTLDAKGLYQAIEVAATRRQPPRLQRMRRHDALCEHQVAGLGHALPLAAACALLGPFDLGTADELRRTLLPDVPFLAFQRVLGLRGLITDGQGWRMSPALARQLLERVGADFVCGVLEWQQRRLAALDPAPGSRAAKMLEREQALVRLQLQMLGPGRARLLPTVKELEAQQGEASLGRRVGERLLTLPSGWLQRRSVPAPAQHRLGRLRGDKISSSGRDPSKRSRWLYLMDACMVMASILLVLAATPAEPHPWLEIVPARDTGVWLVRNNKLEKGGIARFANAYPEGMGTVRLIGFAPGSPVIQIGLPANGTGGAAELREAQGELARYWRCNGGAFDPGPGGPKRLASIVSLPMDRVFDEPRQTLLEQGIATCVVREDSMSLPIHADEIAQTLRAESLDDLPQPRSVGYTIPPSGFWVRPSLAVFDPKAWSFHGRHVDDKGALSLRGTEVSDISSLKGMPLTKLDLWNTKVRDISPLQGMPLTELDLSETKVSDISPLKGIPLTSLGLSNTKVSDISPLKGMPLTSLGLSNTKVSDISPLKDMPLTSLFLMNTRVSDISPLKGMPLTSLFLTNTKVSDISPLQGMPLTSLFLSGTQVSDVSPLKGMPLTSLFLTNTKVGDISPLKGMPLTLLDLRNTKVSDISPLKGMPLTSLFLTNTKVGDISPLKGMPLTKLVLSGLLFEGQELRLLLRAAKDPDLHSLLPQAAENSDAYRELLDKLR